MLTCPKCGATGSDNISVLNESAYASIWGAAGSSASCKCEECGCEFDVDAEGDFVLCDDDYNYDITYDPEEEG